MQATPIFSDVVSSGSVSALKHPCPPARCSTCRMHQLCLPTGLSETEMDNFDRIIARRRRIQQDDSLYHMDDRFNNLYAIRIGHFKTHQVSVDGGEQITGFQMTGDLLGTDAISKDHYNSYAVALEDSEVCEIPFDKLEELFARSPRLLRQFHRVLSQEIIRDQSVMMLLGNMSADQRFAAFLVNLAARYHERGFSVSSFQLRMSRQDIANYLGLTIESVSRLIARFKKEGLAKIRNRDVELLNLPRLKTMALGTGIADDH